MDDLWCPSSVRGGSFSFSLASTAAWQGFFFRRQWHCSRQRTAEDTDMADCRLCPNTGVWAHWHQWWWRGDVWRTEAAGTQPRAGHWLQWLPSTSTGTTAADPDSRNPAWALLLLLQVQSHFTAAAARQAASSQAVWWRVSGCRGAVSSVRCCVITHHNSPPPARAWPGSSYTASCLTSTSPGGPYTTVVTTLTGMGVKYCVETESFYIDIQVWVQLWNLTLRKFEHYKANSCAEVEYFISSSIPVTYIQKSKIKLVIAKK